jgi:hypothetical protein
MEENGLPTKEPAPAIGESRWVNPKRSLIKDVFDLIRGEAIYYVGMVNLPYCEAARYCEFLRSNSSFYDYSELTNRLFRINLHVVPIFVVIMLAIYRMGAATTSYAILIIAVLSFFIITFFLSYHLSKADALLIATYTDEALSGGYLARAPDLITLTHDEDMRLAYKNLTFCSILLKEPGFSYAREEPSSI